MAAIKPLDQIAAKWARVTPLRTDDYRAGVSAPRRDWAQATAGAKQAWSEGVQQAIRNDAFSRGVTAAGSSRWQEGALSKGVQRWGPGVQLAEPRFSEGFAAAHRVLSSLQLPPRFARRDPRNLERVRAVVEALSKLKSARPTS